MLLFGDIHCTSAIIDDLLAGMREHIAKNSEEKNIIFLGDYVYHFSYDRKALLALFGFFVEQARSGKNMYVLAGNHDRISNHFVFSEGEVLLNAFDGGLGEGSLEFITSACIKQVEGEDILFFPYTTIGNDSTIDSSKRSFLLESDNNNEQWSGRANALLFHMIQEWKKTNDVSQKELLVMHHWYINKTAFPGQFAQFSFRSPALSELVLDEEGVLVFSGHLHQPFTYKNYMCCGSLRSTSPLEVNQLKYFFRYKRDASGVPLIQATEYHHNPYFSIPFDGTELHNEYVTTHIDTVRKDAQEQLSQGIIAVQCIETAVSMAQVTLYIINETPGIASLEEYCTDELLTTVRDVKVKTKRRAMGELLEELHDASLSLDSSISDWKTLLKRFLQSRFGEEEAKHYEIILQQLQIV